MEGAATVPILRLRHSPGATRREATRDSRKTGCESESSVREVSCFVPLRQHLHAVCQHGASRKMRSLGRSLLRFEPRRNSSKAHAISVLPRFDCRDSATGEPICAAFVVPRSCRFRAKLGNSIGKRDSIWGSFRVHCTLTCGRAPRADPGLTWLYLA
jgi:hypothetical protein